MAKTQIDLSIKNAGLASLADKNAVRRFAHAQNNVSNSPNRINLFDRKPTIKPNKAKTDLEKSYRYIGKLLREQIKRESDLQIAIANLNQKQRHLLTTIRPRSV